MILTLISTMLIEAATVTGFSLWRKKPLRQILAASVAANILTQLLLWGALNLFTRHYLITLSVAEVLIWLLESALLYFFPNTRLNWREALSLSLGMNLASFGIGWFLPF